MKPYNLEFSKYEAASDQKPKGRVKKKIQRKIRRQMDRQWKRDLKDRDEE